MKEATGELSMTVIVIIGAIAIVGILSFLMPKIKDYINETWTEEFKDKRLESSVICDYDI